MVGMNMPDDTVIEPATVQEIFVDGFSEHAIHDGVMTCIGYRKMKDGKYAVVRLVWPAVNTNAAIEDATLALNTPPRQAVGLKRGVH
jgi:hypothetical protein